MPLFDYHCKDCGAKFEKLIPFSESRQQDCPQCESKNTEKQVSAFATIGGSSGGFGGGCGSGGSGFS